MTSLHRPPFATVAGMEIPTYWHAKRHERIPLKKRMPTKELPFGPSGICLDRDLAKALHDALAKLPVDMHVGMGHVADLFFSFSILLEKMNAGYVVNFVVPHLEKVCEEIWLLMACSGATVDPTVFAPPQLRQPNDSVRIIFVMSRCGGVATKDDDDGGELMTNLRVKNPAVYNMVGLSCQGLRSSRTEAQLGFARQTMVLLGKICYRNTFQDLVMILLLGVCKTFQAESVYPPERIARLEDMVNATRDLYRKLSVKKL